MKCIYILPGATPKELDIDPTLDNLQALVGGLIEVSDWDENLSAYFNEEGLLLGLPPNLIVGNTLLVGPVILMRRSEDGSDPAPSTRDDLSQVLDFVAKNGH